MWGNWIGTILSPLGIFGILLLLGLGTGILGNPIIGVIIVIALAPPLLFLAARRRRGEQTSTDLDDDAPGISKHPETGARAARLGPSWKDFDRGIWGHKREA
jgi:hypothetical protein